MTRWSGSTFGRLLNAVALGVSLTDATLDVSSVYSQTKEMMMSGLSKNTRATVIPCLRYRNAPVAIEWLCQTFGFEKQLVVPTEDSTIAQAQLSFGNEMIMLGSVLETETESGRLIKQPDEIGDFEVQGAYVVVSDADEIYRRAKAAAAKIVIEIKDEDHGGRGFSCRDLEGHLWNFSTYDAW